MEIVDSRTLQAGRIDGNHEELSNDRETLARNLCMIAYVVDIVPGYGVDDIPGLAWSLSERREGVGNYSDFHALYNLPGHLQNPVQTGLGDILPLVYLNYLLSGSPDHLGY